MPEKNTSAKNPSVFSSLDGKSALSYLSARLKAVIAQVDADRILIEAAKGEDALETNDKIDLVNSLELINLRVEAAIRYHEKGIIKWCVDNVMSVQRTLKSLSYDDKDYPINPLSDIARSIIDDKALYRPASDSRDYFVAKIDGRVALTDASIRSILEQLSGEVWLHADVQDMTFTLKGEDNETLVHAAFLRRTALLDLDSENEASVDAPVRMLVDMGPSHKNSLEPWTIAELLRKAARSNDGVLDYSPKRESISFHGSSSDGHRPILDYVFTEEPALKNEFRSFVDIKRAIKAGRLVKLNDDVLSQHESFRYLLVTPDFRQREAQGQPITAWRVNANGYIVDWQENDSHHKYISDVEEVTEFGMPDAYNSEDILPLDEAEIDGLLRLDRGDIDFDQFEWEFEDYGKESQVGNGP